MASSCDPPTLSLSHEGGGERLMSWGCEGCWRAGLKPGLRVLSSLHPESNSRTKSDLSRKSVRRVVEFHPPDKCRT